mmetsp:Transcript_29643/g.95198  ORF Transcript_29643/g.95198 Transcript_29643/m.95198 type:complete len:304 (-) Transcript_29643:407-1318(-)
MLDEGDPAGVPLLAPAPAPAPTPAAAGAGDRGAGGGVCGGGERRDGREGGGESTPCALPDSPVRVELRRLPRPCLPTRGGGEPPPPEGRAADLEGRHGVRRGPPRGPFPLGVLLHPRALLRFAVLEHEVPGGARAEEIPPQAQADGAVHLPERGGNRAQPPVGDAVVAQVEVHGALGVGKHPRHRLGRAVPEAVAAQVDVLEGAVGEHQPGQRRGRVLADAVGAQVDGLERGVVLEAMLHQGRKAQRPHAHVPQAHECEGRAAPHHSDDARQSLRDLRLRESWAHPVVGQVAKVELFDRAVVL